MNSKPNRRLTEAALRSFTGDLPRFRHPLNRSVIYTLGVRFVAETGGAYWLLDAIASYLTPSYLKPHIDRDPHIESLHCWKLMVAHDRSAVLEARVDSACEPFVRQELEFTDFPLPVIQIWAAFDDTHWTLYLPSEH